MITPIHSFSSILSQFYASFQNPVLFTLVGSIVAQIGLSSPDLHTVVTLLIPVLMALLSTKYKVKSKLLSLLLKAVPSVVLLNLPKESLSSSLLN